MSFLDKETKEGEPEKKSAFWDWVVGILIVVGIGGFTVFYQYQKRLSVARFQAADSLYVAGRFKDAVKAYEELKSAQYLTNKNDSLIYARIDTIEILSEREAGFVKDGRKAQAAGDTAGARNSAAQVKLKELLGDEDRAWVDSVKP